jgi:enoyl-CoA hydratase
MGKEKSMEEHAYKTFLFEVVEPAIGLVSLNRPERLNAMNLDMIDDFDELYLRLRRTDCPVRVIIITGKGRGFSSGADLSDAMSGKETDAFSDPEMYMKLVQERYGNLILGLRGIPQPVIAAVNGPAAGGGFALALAADIRVGVPEACFIASFINIGLSGGELGSSYFLPRVVGLPRAADILMTGRKVWGEEAEKIGLLNQLVAKEQLMETALVYARQMVDKTAGGLRYTKLALDRNICAPSLEAAMDLENRTQAVMIFAKDFFSRISAFLAGKQ